MAMTLRINDDLDLRLNKYVEKTGVSKNQFIIEAIERQLEQVEQRHAVRAAVRRVVERDAELLEKLADA